MFPGHGDVPIFIAEQSTWLFKSLQRKYPSIIGSEFLGSQIPFGTQDSNGLRNEDMTKLSFCDQRFRLILSFEVFEHIPDVTAAFREAVRCLEPGGALIFTVPFYPDTATSQLLARLDEMGQVEHLAPPEYHGDPLTSRACLCFHHFGWDILSHLRATGFGTVRVLDCWSQGFGYLGNRNFVFIAQKACSAKTSK
jgi:SAM-dependent methyltransferase